MPYHTPHTYRLLSGFSWYNSGTFHTEYRIPAPLIPCRGQAPAYFSRSQAPRNSFLKFFEDIKFFPAPVPLHTWFPLPRKFLSLLFQISEKFHPQKIIILLSFLLQYLIFLQNIGCTVCSFLKCLPCFLPSVSIIPIRLHEHKVYASMLSTLHRKAMAQGHVGGSVS